MVLSLGLLRLEWETVFSLFRLARLWVMFYIAFMWWLFKVCLIVALPYTLMAMVLRVWLKIMRLTLGGIDPCDVVTDLFHSMVQSCDTASTCIIMCFRIFQRPALWRWFGFVCGATCLCGVLCGFFGWAVVTFMEFFLSVHLQTDGTSGVFCVLMSALMIASSCTAICPDRLLNRLGQFFGQVQCFRAFWHSTDSRMFGLCLTEGAPFWYPVLYVFTVATMKAAVYYMLFPTLEMFGQYHLDLDIAWCVDVPYYGTIPFTTHTSQPAGLYVMYQFLSALFAKWQDPDDLSYWGLMTAKQAWLCEQTISAGFAIRAAWVIPSGAPPWYWPLWAVWAIFSVASVVLLACGVLHLKHAMHGHIFSAFSMCLLKIILPCLLSTSHHRPTANKFMCWTVVLSVLSCGKCLQKLRDHPQPPCWLRKLVALLSSEAAHTDRPRGTFLELRDV